MALPFATATPDGFEVGTVDSGYTSRLAGFKVDSYDGIIFFGRQDQTPCLLRNVGDPLTATDAANKQWVEAALRSKISAITVLKAAVRPVSLSTTNVSSDPNCEGNPWIVGESYLLTAQADPVQNGVWKVAALLENGSLLSRSENLMLGSRAAGVMVFAASGAVYVCSSRSGSDVVGVDGTGWVNNRNQVVGIKGVYRFRDDPSSTLYFTEAHAERLVSVGGTLRLENGSITDTGGKISFGTTDLETQGHLEAATARLGSTLHLASGSVYDDGGHLSLNDNNVDTSGTMTAASFTMLSDRTLKNRIVPLASSLDDLSMLHPSTFRWNMTGRKDVGLIAQDVRKIAPLAAPIDSQSGKMKIDHGRLLTYVISWVQQLNQKVDALSRET